MKLKRLRRRSGGGGVIDRRGQGPTGGGMSLPGMSGIPMGKGGLGIGGVILIVLLVFIVPRCLGSGGFGDLGGALDPFGGDGVVPPGGEEEVNPDDPTGRFADAVLEDVQFAWDGIFDRAGMTYEDTSLVLFRGSTQSGCGPASSATGPFYCPADRLVYIDRQLLQGAGDEVRGGRRLRAGLRDRARGRSSRPDPVGDERRGPTALAGEPGSRPTSSRSGSSSRRTASPGSGAVRPKRRASWSRATSRRD